MYYERHVGDFFADGGRKVEQESLVFTNGYYLSLLQVECGECHNFACMGCANQPLLITI